MIVQPVSPNDSAASVKAPASEPAAQGFAAQLAAAAPAIAGQGAKPGEGQSAMPSPDVASVALLPTGSAASADGASKAPTPRLRKIDDTDDTPTSPSVVAAPLPLPCAIMLFEKPHDRVASPGDLPGDLPGSEGARPAQGDAQQLGATQPPRSLLQLAAAADPVGPTAALPAALTTVLTAALPAVPTAMGLAEVALPPGASAPAVTSEVALPAIMPFDTHAAPEPALPPSASALAAATRHLVEKGRAAGDASPPAAPAPPVVSINSPVSLLPTLAAPRPFVPHQTVDAGTNLAIATDNLGPVRIAVEGGPQDLRVSLAIAADSAALVAGDAARLVADLAAGGMRLQTFDINSLPTDLGSFSGNGPGTQSGHRGRTAVPSPIARVFEPDTTTSRASRADRYA